jgi:hypothetical protein
MNDFVFPSDSGLYAIPGFETNIAFSKRFLEMLPYPYKDCITTDRLNDPAFDYLVNTSKTIKVMKNKFNIKIYNKIYCIKLCFQKYVIDSCGCESYYLPSYVSFNYLRIGCNTIEQDNCLAATDSVFYNSDAILNCLKECPNQCDEIKYETSVSLSEFPTEWYENRYYLNLSEVDLKMISLVNVYMDDMNYVREYEIPAFSFEQLLANIGGSFGLLAGFSVLTFVELFELIIIVVEFFFSKFIHA